MADVVIQSAGPASPVAPAAVRSAVPDLSTPISAAAVERLIGGYAAEGWRDRVHVSGRWRICPYPAVAVHVPTDARVLDVGCGHGLLSLQLALASAHRQITGADIDAGKIAVARRAAARTGATNTRFAVVERGALPTGSWDAITIVDVLYLLGPGGAEAMVDAAAAALAPGGVLVIKEMALRPRWKLRLTRAQELVATRVVRITEGAHPRVVPPDDIAARMRRAGLSVSVCRLDRRRLRPHFLLVGRRSAL
jgi:2-polyprenyl-3-methyl-5-hydroxy-6-metoxy-1,4-benzoquinol methylase